MTKLYAVKEIFKTIQGEGPHAGRVVVLVRFAGCNMWDGKPETKAASTCPFCDTDFVGGFKYSLENLVAEIIKTAAQGKDPLYGVGVMFTGGEPMLQLDFVLLLKLLEECPPDFIDIETNGSKSVMPMMEELSARHLHNLSLVTIICSPKKFFNAESAIACYKVLVPAKEAFVERAIFTNKPVYLQPVMPDAGEDSEEYRQNVAKCVSIALENPVNCRLSLQLHKYAGIK